MREWRLRGEEGSIEGVAKNSGGREGEGGGRERG